MHFYFENSLLENFLSCTDLNSSGIRRFPITPLISTLHRYLSTGQRFNNFDITKLTFEIGTRPSQPYIVPVGVAHSPPDWCGPDIKGNGKHIDFPDRTNLFSHVPDWLFEDMRNGTAWLLLDQTHEGYHADWLFDWFHTSCKQYNVCPSRVIYVTGNASVEDQYREYCKNNSIEIPICALGHLGFEAEVETKRQAKGLNNLPSFSQQLEYKMKNLNSIKIYNALQKRPRSHRAWLFHGLVANGLLDVGINSMNFIEHDRTCHINRFMTEEEYSIIADRMPIMPPLAKDYNNINLNHFSDGDSGKFVEMFNEQITLDSWVSVVSEASFGEETCFISEKSFKPIACNHPFIIYGSSNSLRYLRDMGYKTFHPFINESYDSMYMWDRHDAIIAELKRLSQMTPAELLAWFEGLRDICEHNSKILTYNTLEKLPDAVLKLNDYIEGKA